jgi:hypothetical protein
MTPFLSALFSGMGAVVGTTWNPSDKGGDIFLSNGDRTASNTNTIWECVRGVSGKLTGKYYFEISVDFSSNNGALRVGVANPSVSLMIVPGGSGSLATAYDFQSGQVTYNGTLRATYPSTTTGDRIGVAIDLGNAKFWIAKNGTWAGGSNPATNTGGVSLSSAAPLYPMAGIFGGYSDQQTICTSPQDLLYSAPSGFSLWS